MQVVATCYLNIFVNQNIYKIQSSIVITVTIKKYVNILVDLDHYKRKLFNKD